RAAVEAHLQSCARCFEALERMAEGGAERIADALRGGPGPGLTPANKGTGPTIEVALEGPGLEPLHTALTETPVRVGGEAPATLAPPPDAPPRTWGTALEVLEASIGVVPRVLLRDTAPGEEPGPVVQPSSPEMPSRSVPDGRYQLFGEIARGGMGAVLKGR